MFCISSSVVLCKIFLLKSQNFIYFYSSKDSRNGLWYAYFFLDYCTFLVWKQSSWSGSGLSANTHADKHTTSFHTRSVSWIRSRFTAHPTSPYQSEIWEFPSSFSLFILSIWILNWIGLNWKPIKKMLERYFFYV